MTDEPLRPNLTDQALRQQQARRDREAAALRANLQKRKQQTRARRDDDAAGQGEPPVPGGKADSVNQA